jgi:hypothetical protein
LRGGNATNRKMRSIDEATARIVIILRKFRTSRQIRLVIWTERQAVERFESDFKLIAKLLRCDRNTIERRFQSDSAAIVIVERMQGNHEAILKCATIALNWETIAKGLQRVYNVTRSQSDFEAVGSNYKLIARD